MPNNEDWIKQFNVLSVLFGWDELEAENIRLFIIQWKSRWVEDGIKKAMELYQTHEEGFGDYCDTGEDMEWCCRSKCVEHGTERCKKFLTTLNKDV